MNQPAIHSTLLSRKHYPALDGLRGIAIILVILYHNFNFIEYFNYGWLGVDLFFVLSGFLITDILLDTLDKRYYFRSFYIRRILRIFPLYYLVLVLFIFIFPLFRDFPLDTTYYGENQWWFWAYLQNWLFIRKPEGDSLALFHFWSLAVEEQFYLVWPLLLFVIRKPKRVFLVSFLLLVAVIVVRVFIWKYKEQVHTYEWVLLFTRIDGILIGAMLASIIRYNPQLPRKYFTGTLIIFTALNFLYYFIKRGQDPDFPVWAIGGFTSFCFLFALITLEGIHADNRFLNFVLNLKLLKILGKYSYGFYVFHMPVKLLLIDSANRFSGRIGGESGFAKQLVAALIVSLAGFGISVVVYHLFEKHFLKLKGKFVPDEGVLSSPLKKRPTQ